MVSEAEKSSRRPPNIIKTHLKTRKSTLSQPLTNIFKPYPTNPISARVKTGGGVATYQADNKQDVSDTTDELRFA